MKDFEFIVSNKERKIAVLTAVSIVNQTPVEDESEPERLRKQLLLLNRAISRLVPNDPDVERELPHKEFNPQNFPVDYVLTNTRFDNGATTIETVIVTSPADSGRSVIIGELTSYPPDSEIHTSRRLTTLYPDGVMTVEGFNRSWRGQGQDSVWSKRFDLSTKLIDRTAENAIANAQKIAMSLIKTQRGL